MAELTTQQAFDLAVRHHQAGRLREAEELYERVLAEKPDHAGALHYRGVAAHQTGRIELAVELIGRAVAIRPDDAEAHSNLGLGLRACGRLEEAIAAFRQAVALRPNYAEAHYNLATALKEGGQIDEAITVFRQVIAIRPQLAEAHVSLGTALRDKGQLDAAIAAYQQGIAARPSYAEGHYMLGIALKFKGRYDEAIAAFRRAIELRPNFPEALVHVGLALKDRAELDEAVAAFRRATELRPSYAEGHSYLIYAMHYQAGCDARAIIEEHGRWNVRHAEPLREFIRPHPNDRDPERRLRVGYVSPDFRAFAGAPASALFIDPLLRNHDHGRFEVFCYSEMVPPDGITGRMKACSDQWREAYGWSDEKLDGQIREDRIDILVDLKLHSSGNRLLVFARKPAPIQVSWLGYPGSAGLETIDYRISDRFLEPDGGVYPPPERPMYVPDCFWTYDPMATEPAVNGLPALSAGHVTFGSLNDFCKINETTLRMWAGAMKAVGGSRLLVLGPRGSAHTRLLEKMDGLGVEAGRVEFIDRRPRGEYLKVYHRIDISLDTLPYNGHTTSLDSFWMGVPVVTLAGSLPPGRVGLTHARNLELPEVIASSEADFAKTAANLAGDLESLARLRGSLRDRMVKSPLMDGARFTRAVEAGYRQAWREWCERGSAEG